MREKAWSREAQGMRADLDCASNLQSTPRQETVLAP